MQNTVPEVPKTWYFPYSAFWSADLWGEGFSPLPPLATLLFLIHSIQKKIKRLYNNFFNLINAIQINKIKRFFVFPAVKIAFTKLSSTELSASTQNK